MIRKKHFYFTILGFSFLLLASGNARAYYYEFDVYSLEPTYENIGWFIFNSDDLSVQPPSTNTVLYEHIGLLNYRFNINGTLWAPSNSTIESNDAVISYNWTQSPIAAGQYYLDHLSDFFVSFKNTDTDEILRFYDVLNYGAPPNELPTYNVWSLTSPSGNEIKYGDRTHFGYHIMRPHYAPEPGSLSLLSISVFLLLILGRKLKGTS